MDLVEQGLEAFVFGEPCADLGEQFLGDVDGAGETIVIPNATKPPQMPPTRRRSDRPAAA